MTVRNVQRIGLFVLATSLMFGTTVTYNTAGVFSSSGTNILDGASGLTVTYNNLNGQSVMNPFPTNASFSTLTTVGPTSASAMDSLSGTFNLTITQTVPTSGTETLTNTLTGSIEQQSSNVVLMLTTGSGTGGVPTSASNPITGAAAFEFALGGVTYWVDKVTPIEPQSTNNGVTTISGAISANVASAVPEPATFVMTGLGLLALGIGGNKMRGRKNL